MTDNSEVWAELKEKLPYERTEESKQKRIEQWSQMDVNGNGFLSLAEIDKGMRDVLKLPILFDIKPVLMRAYQAARSVAPSDSKRDDDYVQKSEYRLLLQYLRQYYELWIAFQRVDANGDGSVSYEEFESAKDTMAGWGIDMSDPKAQWTECDADGDGAVMFVEFCDWAVKKNLDLADDDE